MLPKLVLLHLLFGEFDCVDVLLIWRWELEVWSWAIHLIRIELVRIQAAKTGNGRHFRRSELGLPALVGLLPLPVSE